MLANCLNLLFLSELGQISTNFDNFWRKDGKKAKKAKTWFNKLVGLNIPILLPPGTLGLANGNGQTNWTRREFYSIRSGSDSLYSYLYWKFLGAACVECLSGVVAAEQTTNMFVRCDCLWFLSRAFSDDTNRCCRYSGGWSPLAMHYY